MSPDEDIISQLAHNKVVVKPPLSNTVAPTMVDNEDDVDNTFENTAEGSKL